MTNAITFRTLTIDGGVILGGKPATTLRAVDGYAMTWDPGTPWVRVQPPAGLSPVALAPLLIPVARCHGEEEPPRRLGEPPGWLGACDVCTGSVTTRDEPRMMEDGEIRHAECHRKSCQELVAKRAEVAKAQLFPVTEPLSREPEPTGVPAKATGRKGRRPTG